jgi:hypothetical protein
MIDSTLIGSICWLLIMESRGLLGNVFAHIKGRLIYLQQQAEKGKSPAARIVILQEQLVTDSTFRGTVRRIWGGGHVPTERCFLEPGKIFLVG